MLIFEIDNPLTQLFPFGGIIHLGTLIADIGIDVAIDDDELAFIEPTANHRGGFRTVTCINQRHQIGVYLIERSQFTTQKPSHQIAIHRCIKTGEAPYLPVR